MNLENLENKSVMTRRTLLQGLGAALGLGAVGINNSSEAQDKSKQDREIERLREDLKKISSDINEKLQEKYNLDRDTKDTMELIEQNLEHERNFPEYVGTKQNYLNLSKVLEDLIYKEQAELRLAIEKYIISYEDIAKFNTDEKELVEKLTELKRVAIALKNILDTQNKGGSSL